MTGDPRDLCLVNAAGKARMEMFEGREHFVVPVVALMEGVIQAVNAPTPEFVPLATIQKAAASWNGRPVVIGHPSKNGQPCSANEPSVLAEYGIGQVFNSRVEGKKLLQEAWVDAAKVRKLHPELAARLAAGVSDDVSVGAYVVADSGDGTYNGKGYKATWAGAQGDHLAFLPGGRGACSGEMGCGTHRAAMRVCEDALEFLIESAQEMHDRSVSQGAKCTYSNVLNLSTLQEQSFDERQRAVYDAVQKKYSSSSTTVAPSSDYAYPDAVYDDYVIVSKDGKLFKIGYIVNDDGTVTLDGTPEQVEKQVNYVALAAAKMKDCFECMGSGSKNGNPCEACDGVGQIRAACSPRMATVRHEGGQWVLYSKDGTKKLGTHDTEAEALNQEKAIEAAVIRRRNAERGDAAPQTPCGCGNH